MAAKGKLGQIKKITNEHEAELTDGTKVFSPKVNLLDDFYNSVYDQLSGAKINKSNNKTVLGGFVAKGLTGLQGALADPERVVGALRSLKGTIEDTQEYINRNTETDAEFSRYLIQKHLFGWQKEFFECPAKRITDLAGRRSGKSYGMAAFAVEHCNRGYDEIEKDGIVTRKPRKVLIMGLTLKKAREVFWSNILYFIEVGKVKTSKIDNSTFYIEFENGATLQLTGNATSAEREKLRGGEYSLILIDEAQSQPSLRYLMKTILGPIISGRNSTVVLAGTGSLRTSDYWKSITDGEESPNWKHFSSTMLDNPTIAVDSWDEILKENGWTMDSPAFRREYLGENVQDKTRLIYPVYHFNDDLDEEPTLIRAYGGIDYGFSDENAVILVGEDSKGKFHEIYSKVFNHSDIDGIKQRCDEAIKVANEFGIASSDIKFFADTSDQTISKTLFRAGVRVYNTYKFKIEQRISMVNSVLRNGDLTIDRDGDLKYDFENDLWSYDMEKDEIVYEEDPTYHANAAVALGYCMSYVLYKKMGKTEWAEPETEVDPRG